MKKVVIFGATSGIAQEVQRLLIKEGIELLLVARSTERLPIVAADLETRGAVRVAMFAADLADVSTHASVLAYAQEQLPDFDTVLLAYGTMLDQETCKHSVASTLRELDTNFISAAALLTLFAEYFEARKDGCIAAITSVAGDRGRRSNYVYGSAKGALSLFLQGLRSRLHEAGVRVITIKPGPVDTSMTDGKEKGAMFADPKDVARDICRALQKRSSGILYTPWRWRYVMAIVRAIPEPVFKRLNF
ncbi:MAG TPA: SDR family oxidoreductase [Candidatus Acidoferrum sp.]|jgi:short-subunit dehydrogenase